MKKQVVNVCAIISLLLVVGCGKQPKPVGVENEVESTSGAHVDADACDVEKKEPKVEQEVPTPIVDESAKRAAYQAGYYFGHIVGVADRKKGLPRDGIRALKTGEIHGKHEYPDYADEYASGYHLGYNEGWHGE